MEGKSAVRCKACDRIFQDSFNLISHLLIHSDSKFYFCVICLKGFNVLENLEAHVSNHGRKSTLHVYFLSVDLISVPLILSGHFALFYTALDSMIMSTDRYATFESQKDAVSHGQFRKGPFICTECGRISLDQSDWKTHMECVHSKPS